MARASTKQNKTPYQEARESLHLTREAASELLETMSPERIEKIENERCLPHPEEVLLLAERYRQPSLCNYYCSKQCAIGQRYVPEIKPTALSQIVLELLASMNALQKQKERLVEITVDGKIAPEEWEDFQAIRRELTQISTSSEALRLWTERMAALAAVSSEPDTPSAAK